MGIVSYSKVEIETIDEKWYPNRDAKPPKHQSKSLTQLNQSANAKNAAVARFMRRQRTRAPEPTAEQVRRSIRNMFDSLDNQRGW